MKRLMSAVTLSGALLLLAPSAAIAGGPTCEDQFGSGWKNHGEHVLTYVQGDGAGGGAPAHLDARPSGPAPGASFCLPQAKSPGVHF